MMFDSTSGHTLLLAVTTATATAAAAAATTAVGTAATTQNRSLWIAQAKPSYLCELLCAVVCFCCF
jgi:hypothetical protein